ncbi:OsmC family protein [Gelidibacter japonicus]|uniref:OsmC family protein n=1 Tax=Gelidibacter japonicus TaxID=1962232 RepID=UPI0020225193|nr:OsmC family protein [Gelidibacter japonicus]MCL8008348.1 OsmC family protein [Gelidibacter japonicus]
MKYKIKASSVANQDAVIHIKESAINFGTTSKTAETLSNPAELYLGAFAACMLKNVERFSGMMNFSYSRATVEVEAIRLENPPRIESIGYYLTIYSSAKRLNSELLKKNIEKFGTIYNTVKQSCSISGTINTIDND